MTVSDAVANRRSVRQFIDRPVPLETLRRVLEKAQMAPSGCNFQPWEATVLTGQPLRRLGEAIRASEVQSPEEYAVVPRDMPDLYRQRLFEIGEARFAALGIARDDKPARHANMARNYSFFDAPVVLLCHIPRVMGPPQWSDVGMWLQSIMLLLREEGLDSCPQESLSYYGRLIKQHIGVDDETHILFCGLAIGYRDADDPANTFQRPRAPIDEVIRFDGFA